MINKLFFHSIILFVFLLFAGHIPVNAVLKSAKGEANGTFNFQGSSSGTGTLTFINTGGDAHLTTVCDMSTVDTAAGERCEGVDLEGTFSGGRNGTAAFTSATGHVLKFQLKDGKVFSFSTQGISMDFTVTDPSIFDDMVETRDSGARVSDLSGQVEIACPPDLEAWDVMKMGRIILIDCHLKTGEDSSAVISFSDMTTFEMKAESEIVIDTPPQKDPKWKLLMGNIWVNVKKMIKDGTMEGHMSQAVAGIKGTRFRLTETGTESKIEVTEGTVVFKSKANGEEVKVSSGETVTATKNGLSEKTKFDSSEKKPVEINNANPKTIYFAGAGAAVFILIIISASFLRKRNKVS